MLTEADTLSLAGNSCYILDVLAKQAGAWGPECKITQYITLPKGKLSPPTWTGAGEGDYMYTPPRVGTDTVRFILENGAGKKVDVTVKIRTVKWAPESNVGSDSQFAVLEQDDELATGLLSTALDGNGANLSGVSYSFSNLSGAALAQTTGTGANASITLDNNAAGHNWFMKTRKGPGSQYVLLDERTVAAGNNMRLAHFVDYRWTSYRG